MLNSVDLSMPESRYLQPVARARCRVERSTIQTLITRKWCRELASNSLIRARITRRWKWRRRSHSTSTMVAKSSRKNLFQKSTTFTNDHTPLFIGHIQHMTHDLQFTTHDLTFTTHDLTETTYTKTSIIQHDSNKHNDLSIKRHNRQQRLAA